MNKGSTFVIDVVQCVILSIIVAGVVAILHFIWENPWWLIFAGFVIGIAYGIEHLKKLGATNAKR